jgi:adenine C2-methylase RlmN of 23S rRNA A2503 and tRNA A37
LRSTQARELAKIARRLSAKINLIPYNTFEGTVAVAYDRIATQVSAFRYRKAI